MGKYQTKDNKKSNEQKFYERVIRMIGALILHSVGATVLIMVTILFGIKCATSGGYWIYLLSLIVSITTTVSCIGGIIIDIYNILFFIKELHDGNRKY